MSSAPKSIRVLIVDDEHSVADTLALILSRSGHEALAVYSGMEAIDAAQNFMPHAVISDVMMPGMNGIQLAQYFADNFSGFRVLLMTGHDSAMPVVEKYLGGCGSVPVLTKPALPQNILAFIARCAEQVSA